MNLITLSKLKKSSTNIWEDITVLKGLTLVTPFIKDDYSLEGSFVELFNKQRKITLNHGR